MFLHQVPIDPRWLMEELEKEREVFLNRPQTWSVATAEDQGKPTVCGETGTTGW